MKVFNQEKVRGLYPECCMMAEAMRIWSLPKNKEDMLEKICESGDYFAQIKKDGYFYQFVKGEKDSYLFSRNVSVSTGLLTEKIDNVPHIKEALSVLPKDTIIIGEVYMEGGTSKDVTKIMGCLKKKAIERQEKEGFAKFYVHDIISFNGVSLMEVGALKRYEILKQVYNDYNLKEQEYIELADLYLNNIFQEIKFALDRGEEGMVLKKKDHPYVPGKKPAWSSIKCKKSDYVDVVCMGFEDATPEYNGKEIEGWEYWINSETKEFYPIGQHYKKHIEGEPCLPVTKPYYFNWKTSMKIGGFNENGALEELGTCSSGITDELREDFSNNPNNYIGKTVMVQCMEKDNKSHTLRHPALKGFREDKNPKECTLEDIFSV